MKVSIIVFEMNEIDGMRSIMPQIKPEWYDELIIVDGGSTDGSIEYASEKGYTLFVQKEKGIGAAFNEAVQKATGDIVVLFAPDGSFIPDRIPLMIEKIFQGYDFVNVTRYGYGAKSIDDTPATAFGNWFFVQMVNLFFGHQFKFTDFLYSYVAFKRQMVNDLKHESNLITWNQILMLKAIKNGYKLIEIPGDEPKRIGGSVKVAKLPTAWIVFFTIIKERFGS
jgi:glycosyltransferase involved in cell wall biosynthesis